MKDMVIKKVIILISMTFVLSTCSLFDSGGSSGEIAWSGGGGAVPQDDGLPDAYEVTGMTYNGLNLYDDYGCTPDQIDLLLHIAPMHLESGLDDPAGTDDPGMMLQKKALDKVVAAFADVGITLHIDVGNAGLYNGDLHITGRDETSYNYSNSDHRIPYANSISLSSSVDSSVDAYLETYFNDTSYFPAARKYAFYFMVFGSTQNSDGTGGSSGIAWVNDRRFLITLEGWGFDFDENTDLGLTSNDMITYVANKQASTIMHEFGHNLGLLHGGGESTNYKPNYYSIMNYLYQMQGLPVIGNNEGDRYYFERMYQAYLDGGYDDDFWGWYDLIGTTQLGSWYYNIPLDFQNSAFTDSFTMDYSHGYGGPKSEDNIYESTGLRQSGSGTVDFNGSGSISDGIFENINLSYDSSYDDLYDYDDWANLYYYYAYNSSGSSRSVVDDAELEVVKEYNKPINFLADLESYNE